MAINLQQTYEGAYNILLAAQSSGSPNWGIGLFDGTYTFDDSSTFVGVTAKEAAWAGYSRAYPVWPTVTNMGTFTATTSPVVTFTYTGGGSVTNNGVFVTNQPNTKLLGGAMFPVPVVLTPSQPSYSVQITYTQLPQY